MAKYVYPAVFTHEAEGGYSINFPHLKTALPQRLRWRKELKWLQMLLCLTLYGMEEDGVTPPAPSDVRSIHTEENELTTPGSVATQSNIESFLITRQ